MSFKVGVGIVTFNRREILSGTIDRVRALTRQPDAALVIADDGSTDGTLTMLRDKQVPVITGVNMGIAWNKNRALFLLSHLLGCDTVILLEDDTRPDRSGWESEWMEAASRWGHVNLAGHWMQEHFLSGAGTVEDPVRSKMVTAQCSAYSRGALTFAGYFDPRFKGFGHEHVEHTRRLIRVGYGGTDRRVNGEEQVIYNLIKGGVTVVSAQSYYNQQEEERNLQLARRIMGDQGYRSPWGLDDELRQFRSETESAMSDGPDRFRLTPRTPHASSRQPAGRGLFSRLFRRS
ncbi:glycosyltransferase family 2 protein [Rhodopila sp.]|uniref:glycosyltransferase family 2 protein n=1 Tax=Rhodopila sp. TaxID=2480087 RepID=UPI003D0CB3F8